MFPETRASGAAAQANQRTDGEFAATRGTIRRSLLARSASDRATRDLAPAVGRAPFHLSPDRAVGVTLPCCSHARVSSSISQVVLALPQTVLMSAALSDQPC